MLHAQVKLLEIVEVLTVCDDVWKLGACWVKEYSRMPGQGTGVPHSRGASRPGLGCPGPSFVTSGTFLPSLNPGCSLLSWGW